MDKTQRVTSYVSGAGITVYEIEQYNADTKQWYIVGDSTTRLDLVTTMVQNHNSRLYWDNWRKLND
jgi:hypothetical protein